MATLNNQRVYDLVGGRPTPPKNMREVSWDDFPFPAEWKVIKVMFQSTNQIYHRNPWKFFG